LVDTTVENLAGHDVVVLALPHGASGQIAAALPPECLVVDLGADHRLKDPAAWTQFYGSPHAGTWTYGMPELPGNASDIAASRRIAVPGCNVMAVTLGLLPGVTSGILDVSDIVAVLANGYSGAGKALKPHLLASEALGSASPYAVGGVHRHIPEIQQNLAQVTSGNPADVGITFTPTLVPMSRGILATVTARLTPTSAETPATTLETTPEATLTATDLHSLWTEFYADRPSVTVLPEGRWPSTGAVLGSNATQIGVTVDRGTGRLTVVVAIDNLVKGTAGTAMECVNLALGLPADLGLTTVGVAP
jgi:N-acetyl-gamma-glutamyl-phosphate reductase